MRHSPSSQSCWAKISTAGHLGLLVCLLPELIVGMSIMPATNDNDLVCVDHPPIPADLLTSPRWVGTLRTGCGNG